MYTTLRPERRGGDYPLLEQVEVWKLVNGLVCAYVLTPVCVFMRGRRGGGAWDARIKKRLVEIKALLQSLPAGLRLTRMTNPSFITPR